MLYVSKWSVEALQNSLIGINRKKWLCYLSIPVLIFWIYFYCMLDNKSPQNQQFIIIHIYYLILLWNKGPGQLLQSCDQVWAGLLSSRDSSRKESVYRLIQLPWQTLFGCDLVTELPALTASLLMIGRCLQMLEMVHCTLCQMTLFLIYNTPFASSRSSWCVLAGWNLTSLSWCSFTSSQDWYP